MLRSFKSLQLRRDASGHENGKIRARHPAQKVVPECCLLSACTIGGARGRAQGCRRAQWCRSQCSLCLVGNSGLWEPCQKKAAGLSWHCLCCRRFQLPVQKVIQLGCLRLEQAHRIALQGAQHPHVGARTEFRELTHATDRRSPVGRLLPELRMGRNFRAVELLLQVGYTLHVKISGTQWSQHVRKHAPLLKGALEAMSWQHQLPEPTHLAPYPCHALSPDHVCCDEALDCQEQFLTL